MKRTLLLTIFILSLISYSFGQKRIRVEPISRYSRLKKENRNSRWMHSFAKRAREDIIYSDTHKRVEYCYYLGFERICYGETYRLIGDSTLQIGDTLYNNKVHQWTYRKLENGNFFVYSNFDNVYEFGIVKELIPFERIGNFIVTKKNKKDTLWIADYSKVDMSKLYSEPIIQIYKSKICGKIYDADEVDISPSLINGDSIPEIKLERLSYQFCEPWMMVVKNMSFIISNTGVILNIEQYNGFFDNNDPYILELMKEIIKMEPLKPAIVDGEYVNSKCYVEIDMMDEQLKEFRNHPALDTKPIPRKK
ncbi:MAG: hypothetical protein K9J13_12640 [Saprospiraceae bacterium]|nr:hypothetical protein [Saprospiraceae bacterium]